MISTPQWRRMRNADARRNRRAAVAQARERVMRRDAFYYFTRFLETNPSFLECLRASYALFRELGHGRVRALVGPLGYVKTYIIEVFEAFA